MGAWYLLTVRFLKTNSGKKGEGMPVVRNPQFYFRERETKKCHPTKNPPRLLSRGVSIQTDFGLKSKILKIQPSKSRRIPYDQSKRPAPYCISTISEL